MSNEQNEELRWVCAHVARIRDLAEERDGRAFVVVMEEIAEIANRILGPEWARPAKHELLRPGAVVEASVRVGRGVNRRVCIVDEAEERTRWDGSTHWFVVGRYRTNAGRWSTQQRCLAGPWYPAAPGASTP